MQIATTATLSMQAQLWPSEGSDLETQRCCPSPGSALGPREGGPGFPTHLLCTHLRDRYRVPPDPHCCSPRTQGGRQRSGRVSLASLPSRSAPGRGSPRMAWGGRVSWGGSLAGDTAGEEHHSPARAHEGVLGMTADSQEGKEECRAFSGESWASRCWEVSRESQTSGQVTWSLTACQLSLGGLSPPC